MTTPINFRAAALAALVTLATLQGMGAIANSEHRDALAVASASTMVAAAEPAPQQVVVVGRRARG